MNNQLKEEYGEQLEELINEIRRDSSTDSVHIHNFIGSVREQALQEVVKEIEQDPSENYGTDEKDKIIALIKEKI